ncbi:hypothetical protein B0H13DRAFT_2322416 [Mycena leptocephala]|nr:hypothetical protein B0H13DRAFT_2322416 [Mycena leptocephala]
MAIRLSINYGGNLTLSSDRVSVRNDWQMNHYRRDVRATMDWAFRTLPELAVELALDILTDDHSNALAGILVPDNKSSVSEYRVAFDTAMRQRRRSAAPTAFPLHPYAGSNENLKLFSELGLTPFKVLHKALNIMYQSGAYTPVTEHARDVLLSSPPISDFPGLDRLRAALQSAVPGVPLDSITVRKYDKLYPTVIWDDENKHFTFVLPKPCEDHPEAQCLCWIGPVLHDASKEYKGPTIAVRKLWRAFAVEMGGDTTAKPAASEKPNGSHPNPTSTTSQSAQKTSTKSQVSSTDRKRHPRLYRHVDEATSNMLALGQFGKTILGYDVFKKCDAMASNFAAQQKRVEDLSSASGAKDGRIMELEENKDLREDLTYYEDGAAARRAKREFKRQSTA